MTTPLVCTEDGVCQLDPAQPSSSTVTADKEVATVTDQERSDEKNSEPIDTTSSGNTKRQQQQQQQQPGKQQQKANSSNINVPKIHSQQDLEQRLQSRRGGSDDDVPLLVEFVTTWCGACKSIQPLYEELATTNADGGVQCSQVVCDKNKETKKLAAAYTVRSYPVFILFDEQGNQVDRWEGADPGKLEKAFDYRGGGGKGGGKKKKGKGGKRR
jgi:thiol-disulfide isomerase/thioredoxin